MFYIYTNSLTLQIVIGVQSISVSTSLELDFIIKYNEICK